MKTAIIINTIYRPLELVQRAVKSALEQSLPVQWIVLVDQNSPALTLDPSLLKDPRFLHFKNPVPSVSLARNSAPLPEDSEWIIFCDDDGYLEEDYVAKLEQERKQHPEWDVIAGAILREDNQDFYTSRQKLGTDIHSFASTKLLMGSNFSVRKNVFCELGKFDPRFGAGSPSGSSEETDFCWKAFFSGKKLAYRKNLIVFHVPPFQENYQLAFSKSYRYGRGKALLVKKWLWEEKQVWVLLELAEMLLVPLAQVILGLITGKFARSVAAAGSWLGRLNGLFFQSLGPR